jgi:hypothetical protein
LQANFELRPNRIEFHTADEMRVLHQVGVALKEQKVVDHRPKAGAPAPPAATELANGHVDTRPLNLGRGEAASANAR